ncbi:MAG: MBL fold metallo-hydrolase [Patescibacteria group bacterium]|nr:MBL fold metallo-hydrolase [Patescibacteria group bacterium]
MYRKKGGLYLQAGEQLVAPGATAHLLSICGKVIAIDSGMGLRDEKLGGNYFPYYGEYAGKVDLILMTHHHLDHSGNIPALARANPKARIMFTRPAAIGAEIMLKDSLKIHEIEQRDKVFEKRGDPIPFIYTKKSLQDMYKRIEPIPKPGWTSVWPGWSFGFYSAGHTRGAVMTFIIPPQGPAYFITGDVCSHNQPLQGGVMLPPREFFGSRLNGKKIVVITEATYGNRIADQPIGELWNKLGEIVQKARAELRQAFMPSFSDREPHIAKALIDLGIVPHLDGMGRDFFLKQGDEDYRWCPQDVAIDVKALIRDKKVILYKKLTRKDPQEAHEAEASHRLATAAGHCCGMSYSPIISSSAMMDKGMSVSHAMEILPNPKAMVIHTGHIFPHTVGEATLRARKGDTVKLTMLDRGHKTERPVPVSCDVIQIGLSGHDPADKLVERVHLLNEICPVEAVIAHHGDQENVDGLMRRLKSDFTVFHGKHGVEIPL